MFLRTGRWWCGRGSGGRRQLNKQVMRPTEVYCAEGQPLTGKLLKSLCSPLRRQVVVRVGERRKATAAAKGAKEEDAIADDEVCQPSAFPRVSLMSTPCRSKVRGVV